MLIQVITLDLTQKFKRGKRFLKLRSNTIWAINYFIEGARETSKLNSFYL